MALTVEPLPQLLGPGSPGSISPNRSPRHSRPICATTQGDEDRRQTTRGPHGEILVLDGAKEWANAWPTDVTFTAKPPIGSLLAMQSCPTRGGDTTRVLHRVTIYDRTT